MLKQTSFVRVMVASAVAVMMGAATLQQPVAAQDSPPARDEFELVKSFDLAAVQAMVSDNGKWILYESLSGDLALRDIETGVDVYALAGANPILWFDQMTMTSDGSYVVFVDSESSKLWHTTTGVVETIGPVGDQVGISGDGREYYVYNGTDYSAVNLQWRISNRSYPFVPFVLVHAGSQGNFEVFLDVADPSRFNAVEMYPNTYNYSGNFSVRSESWVCSRSEYFCSIDLAKRLGWTVQEEEGATPTTTRLFYFAALAHLYAKPSGGFDGHFIEIHTDRIELRSLAGKSTSSVSRATSLDDLVHSYDYGPEDAKVTRLYQAYFGRTPDVMGLRYWIGLRHDGTTLQEIAYWFSQSEEFKLQYAGTTNDGYTTSVYGNMLGRIPDQEGYEYWLGLLNAGELDRSGIVFWVTANEEFIATYPFLP